MKSLIVEDDLASRKFMHKFLSQYGECDITIDGIEAIDAFMIAHDLSNPYDLICLDIMMPKIDGIKVLKTIRAIEKHKGIKEEDCVKVIMVSALNETEVIFDAFDAGSQAYATKPINTEKLLEVLMKLELT